LVSNCVPAITSLTSPRPARRTPGAGRAHCRTMQVPVFRAAGAWCRFFDLRSEGQGRMARGVAAVLRRIRVALLLWWRLAALSQTANAPSAPATAPADTPVRFGILPLGGAFE